MMLAPQRTIFAVVAAVSTWVASVIASSQGLSSYQRRNDVCCSRAASSLAQSAAPYVVGLPLSSHAGPRVNTHWFHAPGPQLPTSMTCLPAARTSAALVSYGIDVQSPAFAPAGG